MSYYWQKDCTWRWIWAKQRGTENEEDGTVVKEEHLLRRSFIRQAFVPYPHLFPPWSTISSISSATVWACLSVLRRSKTFANTVESDQRAVRRFLPFLQTAITFDSFGVTGATTYQNEALSCSTFLKVRILMDQFCVQNNSILSFFYSSDFFVHTFIPRSLWYE